MIIFGRKIALLFLEISVIACVIAFVGGLSLPKHENYMRCDECLWFEYKIRVVSWDRAGFEVATDFFLTNMLLCSARSIIRTICTF